MIRQCLGVIRAFGGVPQSGGVEIWLDGGRDDRQTHVDEVRGSAPDDEWRGSAR
jgi:hypothetical protein